MVYSSRIVKVGSLLLGGDNPVRVQSMTNTNTLDTKASVAQCIRIIEAGGELVRLTAQGVREAGNLAEIKRELRAAHFETPLVADIHFNPAAAETAARLVEKVRINPGNYADKRASFADVRFTDAEYTGELERIRERVLPLINICREYGTVIRIGVNHGSLSDRIMTRYGNTPEGMAVSAVEFLDIFRGEGFNDMVVSMKSSDSRVMVESNLLLVEMMTARGMDYPVHIGITEAGEGEDGRIISASGIGTLLSAGIGDTIRVSLSEPPEKEIPVAKEIVSIISSGTGRVKEKTDTIRFTEREERYIPEVLVPAGDSYVREFPELPQGEVVCCDAGNMPLLSELPAGDLIIDVTFAEDDAERLSVNAAALLGRYFITRRVQGICIRNRGKVQGDKLKELCYSILQATEARITRTRYISCPTCGRTKFDLAAEVKKVKRATAHLTGLKIAVMGCIVNGPGEMAGADYGYVGAGEGKVHIYRHSKAVLLNIPEEEAVQRLLSLIESDAGMR